MLLTVTQNTNKSYNRKYTNKLNSAKKYKELRQ